MKIVNKKIASTLAAAAALVFSSLSMAAPVNVNTASAEQIAEALNGVGLSRAMAIVEYRDSNGKFSSPDELIAVKGIGEATLERNREDILVK